MVTKEKFFAAIGELAKKHGYQIGMFGLDIYDEELSKYGYERLLQISRKFYVYSKAMPTVGDFLTELGVAPPPPAPSTKDVANEIVTKIVKAMSSCGGYRDLEAKERIGELGWDAVQACGGWGSLCMTNEDDLNFLKAQLRDAIDANIKMTAHREKAALTKASMEQLDLKKIAIEGKI